jgi:hypothetical protein
MRSDLHAEPCRDIGTVQLAGRLEVEGAVLTLDCLVTSFLRYRCWSEMVHRGIDSTNPRDVAMLRCWTCFAMHMLRSKLVDILHYLLLAMPRTNFTDQQRDRQDTPWLPPSVNPNAGSIIRTSTLVGATPSREDAAKSVHHVQHTRAKESTPFIRSRTSHSEAQERTPIRPSSTPMPASGHPRSFQPLRKSTLVLRSPESDFLRQRL